MPNMNMTLVPAREPFKRHFILAAWATPKTFNFQGLAMGALYERLSMWGRFYLDREHRIFMNVIGADPAKESYSSTATKQAATA